MSSPNVLPEQMPAEIIGAAWEVAQRLDVLVSNDAYHPIHGPIADAVIEDLHATLERLIAFPFALAKAAIPRFIAQSHARVVMITSNRTRLPFSGGAIPDIARAGLNANVFSAGAVCRGSYWPGVCSTGRSRGAAWATRRNWRTDSVPGNDARNLSYRIDHRLFGWLASRTATPTMTVGQCWPTMASIRVGRHQVCC